MEKHRPLRSRRGSASAAAYAHAKLATVSLEQLQGRDNADMTSNMVSKSSWAGNDDDFEHVETLKHWFQVNVPYSFKNFATVNLDVQLALELKSISVRENCTQNRSERTWPNGWERLQIYFPYDQEPYNFPEPVAMHNLAAYLPAAIVMARCKDDIIQVLNILNKYPGTPRCVKSGGHDYRAASSCRGVMIDVSRMNSVEYDSNTRSITAETGANLGMIMHKLYEVKRSAPHGDSVAVGLGGHGLHGGWDALMSRQLGLLTQNIVGGTAVLWNGDEVEFENDKNDPLKRDLLFLARGGGFEDIGIVVTLTFPTFARPPFMCTVARITPNLTKTPFSAEGFSYVTNGLPANIAIGWKISHEVVKQGMWIMGRKCEKLGVKTVVIDLDRKSVTGGDLDFSYSINDLNKKIFGNSPKQQEWWFKTEHDPAGGSFLGPLEEKRNKRHADLDDLHEARLSSYSDFLINNSDQLATRFSYEYELEPQFFHEGDRYIEMSQGYLTQRSFYVPSNILTEKKDECQNIFQNVNQVLTDVGTYNAQKLKDDQKLYAFTTIAPAGHALKDWKSSLKARCCKSSNVHQKWHEKETDVGAAIRSPGDVWIFRFECHWYARNPEKKTRCFEFALKYELAVGPCSNDGIFFADRWENSWGSDAFYSDSKRVRDIKYRNWASRKHSGFVGDLPNLWR